ncbi:ribosome small subunit-dependent GTPase A [Polaribacter sp. Hel1_85]|uniref:ribosome small subunit-dependent GTPase A n=1 Tax=Polaribacter sp. Hel1_85 TaxID=1250005 RepID=UPI00052BD63D|nr:ribosome small subunit-dependent GTPase A [Polaribacter sp. Hel1_85]KGL58599.1 ribosome-associated GTPase [Polaribacter sp. Hel1_85]
MNNEDLGYNSSFEDFRIEQNLTSFDVARVISEHKDRYTVKNSANEFEAEIIGNLRFNSINRKDLPAVGDWVAISEYDKNKALIHAVFPRKAILERKAVGKLGQTQIIATNIDFGIIVQSVNRDFSINRLERYLTICNASKIEPIIVLSKIDLIDKDELNEVLKTIEKRIKNVPIFTISNQSLVGIEEIKASLIKGKTYCLLGSSGVGKSTLINILTGTNLMDTGAISESIDRGKHITSHRELIVFDNGILIDNPGMREIGMTDISHGIEMTFEEILELAKDCKFSDCSHTSERGCAVLKALENKELDKDSFNNFQKMERERDYFESTVTEKKQQGKDLAKLIRQNKKRRDNNKY